MDYTLLCMNCKNSYPHTYQHQICGSCKGLLEVIYDEKARIKSHKNISFWNYRRLLPKGKYKRFKVGGTRLIKHPKFSNLYLKLETENPTRSFKDRGSLIEVTKAKEYDYKEAVCASTGNMAYSISYYAKKLGIKSKVFISHDANRNKVADIRSMGDADVVRISGDFTKAQKLAENYAIKKGAFLTGDYCYRKEGQKTIAYEIMQQLPDATHMIVPVGNATLISGLYKALKELKEMKIIKNFPRLIAVQSENCKPLVRAFDSKKNIRYEKPKTLADAIAVGYPTFGYQGITALKETKGRAIAVSEEVMAAEQKAIHKDLGLTIELASAATIAAFKRLRFKPKDKVVAIITGGNV